MNQRFFRGRRLREKAWIRNLVRETRVLPSDLIQPIFVIDGRSRRVPVESMQGVDRLSADMLGRETEAIRSAGVNAVLIFGVPDAKDSKGSPAWKENGVVQEAIREIKRSDPEMTVITDVCLCAYTDHGHCGHLDEHGVNNDATLEALGKMALSHAEAGADVVAPSDMMDGRVGYIRMTLDENGFTYLPILSYAAKYASAFYGPFRDAAQSAPKQGNRKSYQMDHPNVRQAMRELKADLQEGADMLMVKPALAYLDVIAMARQRFDVPIFAYNVSGEYSMVKAAAAKGWIDENAVALEILTAIKRAGADRIISYWAKTFSKMG